jgi:hypothetical protein
MHSIGPDIKADLVIYFKLGVTNEEISSFWENVLSFQDPNGRGHHHRPGVGGLSAVFPAVDGHEGVAVNFLPGATEAQRTETKLAVDGSPLVFKVLQNVVPSDVKKL